MSAPEPLLIGVDGGATEVKAHAVACDDLANPASFSLRPESAACCYRETAGFTPVPLAEQLAQRQAGRIRPTAAEVTQGRAWIDAAAAAIAEVAGQCGMRRILVGLGMPGLKTPDQRGIAVCNNGPRIPDYLDALNDALAAAGLELAAPLSRLGSDADCCGAGEEHAADGLFRDVENAYYVGCGTGIADALKLHGRLIPFDDAQTWLLKAWQFPCILGPTFEQLISASGLNRVYGQLHARSGATAPPEPASPYPEVQAAAGDPTAIAWLETAALVLAELIFERLWTIRRGRPDDPPRGLAYADLDPDHPFRGTILDRVIVGQRLGRILGQPDYRPFFHDRLAACLAVAIENTHDEDLIAACLQERHLRPGWLVASRLRAAPALGAAIAAVQRWSVPV